jgi:hypothetical protein
MTLSSVNRLMLSFRALLLATAAGAMVQLALFAAQSTGSTALAVRIAPEARLNPQSIAVTIQVDASGAVTAQTATLQAWIRALPGQTIQLVACAGDVTGPAGTLPPGVLRWEGVAIGATGGGRDAHCTSGAFTGAADLLASGWARPGTLTCQVRVTLDGAQTPAPGVYTARIYLALYGQ